MSFVSYAQNSEDVLLHRVFGGQAKGFYVDVGAWHPVIDSVTKVFYDRGWSGINVEPGSVFAELAKARPRDVNLQMALWDHAGEVAFIEKRDVESGMSHVDLHNSGDGTGRMVQCDTLEAIVQRHSDRRPIDFIKIDVEGAEAAIIRSTNWRSLRPRVLLIEATLPQSCVLANQEWEPILLEQGYIRVYFDGINCFYIPEEELPFLQRHFQVPVNVLDSFVTAECQKFRVASWECREETVRAVAERDALRDQLAQAMMERDTFHDRLEDQHKENVRTTAERDALNSALQAQRAESAQLAAERETLTLAIENERRVTARLSAELKAAHEEVARLAAERAASAANHSPASKQDSSRRSIARRLAFAAYWLIRPIVRPVAWRTRSFLVGRLHDEMHILMQTVRTRNEAMTHEIHGLAQGLYGLAQGLYRRDLDDSAAIEMRRLATEMERILYSVAIGRSWPTDLRIDRVTPETAPP